jgi:hypothetical protein
MHWDRFDIVEAWYLTLAECHSGQWSPEYARLCRILEYFTPGSLFSFDSLNENSREIYAQACVRLLKQGEE